MELLILKKKINTYESSGGQLRGVPAEILCELLRAWESWTGTAKDFYREIGYSSKQMAGLMGKAKRLQREGGFGSSNFKEVEVLEGVPVGGVSIGAGGQIEVIWKESHIIRFAQVEQLVEFLKKVA